MGNIDHVRIVLLVAGDRAIALDYVRYARRKRLHCRSKPALQIRIFKSERAPCHSLVRVCYSALNMKPQRFQAGVSARELLARGRGDGVRAEPLTASAQHAMKLGHFRR